MSSAEKALARSFTPGGSKSHETRDSLDSGIFSSRQCNTCTRCSRRTHSLPWSSSLSRRCSRLAPSKRPVQAATRDERHADRSVSSLCSNRSIGSIPSPAPSSPPLVDDGPQHGCRWITVDNRTRMTLSLSFAGWQYGQHQGGCAGEADIC